LQVNCVPDTVESQLPGIPDARESKITGVLDTGESRIARFPDAGDSRIAVIQGSHLISYLLKETFFLQVGQWVPKNAKFYADVKSEDRIDKNCTNKKLFLKS